MLRVQFLQRYSNYHVGETAGFTDDFARKLVSMGWANLVGEKSNGEVERTEAADEKQSRPRKRRGYGSPPADKMVAGPHEKK